jgi:predicted phosphoribosyltransferase
MLGTGAKYRDRKEAGDILASRLEGTAKADSFVLTIPNGGVAVGVPIAKSLRCALRLLVVRKIQIPWNTEAGFGAVAADGTTVIDSKLLTHLGLSQSEIEEQKRKALMSIQNRLDRFGSWAIVPQLTGKTAILVDDGLASGSTMEAAVGIVRAREAGRVVLAVPTASMRAYRRLEPLVDELICPDVSRLSVFAVADAYENWYDVSEEEVISLLGSLGMPTLDQEGGDSV